MCVKRNETAPNENKTLDLKSSKKSPSALNTSPTTIGRDWYPMTEYTNAASSKQNGGLESHLR